MSSFSSLKKLKIVECSQLDWANDIPLLLHTPKSIGIPLPLLRRGPISILSNLRGTQGSHLGAFSSFDNRE
ncbi:hypothetical protein V6N13_001762 [Hibiscus sabdariffa]